jgi:hypothetical protein
MHNPQITVRFVFVGIFMVSTSFYMFGAILQQRISVCKPPGGLKIKLKANFRFVGEITIAPVGRGLAPAVLDLQLFSLRREQAPALPCPIVLFDKLKFDEYCVNREVLVEIR